MVIVFHQIGFVFFLRVHCTIRRIHHGDPRVMYKMFYSTTNGKCLLFDLMRLDERQILSMNLTENISIG